MKRVFSLFTASACIAGPAGVTRWLLVNVEEAGVGEPGERPRRWMKIKYLQWQLSQPVACWINISMRSEWSKIIHSVTDEACGWDVSLPFKVLPAWSFIVWAGAGLAVIWATSTRVTKVSRAALITLWPLCVVLAALWKEVNTRHSPADSGYPEGYVWQLRWGR